MVQAMPVIARTPGPHHRWAGSRPGRRATMVVAVAMLAAALWGCIEAPEWIFYATNESAEQVIINADIRPSVVLPPHSYAILNGGKGAQTGGWRVEIVDADCRALSAVTVADGDEYAIVAADGHLSTAASRTFAGQTQVTLSMVKPPRTCPLPRERGSGG